MPNNGRICFYPKKPMQELIELEKPGKNGITDLVNKLASYYLEGQRKRKPITFSVPKTEDIADLCANANVLPTDFDHFDEMGQEDQEQLTAEFLDNLDALGSLKDYADPEFQGVLAEWIRSGTTSEESLVLEGLRTALMAWAGDRFNSFRGKTHV